MSDHADQAAADCCGLRLESAVREDARRRLLSVRGHVDGILRMLEPEQVYCVNVLRQLKAVNGALDRIGDLVLKSHLKNHVVTPHERGDEERILEELMEILKYR